MVDLNDVSDDDAVTAEDREFFLDALRADTSATFLNNMALPEPKQWVNPRKAKRKRALALAKIDQDETDFEKNPRARPKNADEDDDGPKVNRLPIKVGKKLIVPKPKTFAAKPVVQTKDDDEEPDSEDEDNSDNENDSGGKKAKKEVPQKPKQPEPVVDRVTMLALREKHLIAKKMEIASLSSDILSDVEKASNPLRKLRELCSCKDEGVAASVQKLAIMSLATVFKDIVPGYRIREITKKEKDVVVSKDVKQVREHEQMMLRNYQMYLQRLHSLMKECDAPKENTAELREAGKMRMVCIKALCMLLRDIPHFNYRSNIIEIVVPRMTDFKNEKIAILCCDTIQKLFKEDEAFDATQETVKAMSRVIKASNYRVRSDMIKSFFFLRLNGSIIKEYLKNKAQKGKDDMNDGPKKRHKTRMDKKEQKAEKELNKELKEAQVTIDRRAMARRQTEVLNQVFATYFRVLKHGRHSPILPIVLEGIAKQAHLIDASFFGDLMAVLREIMSDNLGTSISLQTVRTACMLLSGQAGMAMNIDVKAFHDVLYSEILNATDERGVDLSMICIRLLLNERREVSLERVGAFTKRLANVALQTTRHNQVVTALSNIRSMLQRYPKLETLLDSDSMSTAIYRPEVPEPEHSNPLSTPLWELTLLNKHYFPWVKTYAKHLAYGAPSGGSNSLPPRMGRALPHALSKNLDPRQHGFCFNPEMQKPKSHPLQKNLPQSGFRHSAHIVDNGLKFDIPKFDNNIDFTKDELDEAEVAAFDRRGYRAIVKSVSNFQQMNINDRREARLEALKAITEKFVENRAKLDAEKKKKKKLQEQKATKGDAKAGKTKQQDKPKKKKKKKSIAVTN